MAPFKDLTPTDHLPARPSDYSLSAVWVVGGKSTRVQESDHPAGPDEGSKFVASCRFEGPLQSVGVHRGDGKFMRVTSQSPTGRHKRVVTQIHKRAVQIAGELRSAYQEACREGEEAMLRDLARFHQAVANQEIKPTPLAKGAGYLLTANNKYPVPFERLIDEYDYYLGKGALARKLGGVDPGRAATWRFKTAGLEVDAVDIDNNGEFDILFAENIWTGASYYLYDVERLPAEWRENLPTWEGKSDPYLPDCPFVHLHELDRFDFATQTLCRPFRTAIRTTPFQTEVARVGQEYCRDGGVCRQVVSTEEWDIYNVLLVDGANWFYNRFADYLVFSYHTNSRYYSQFSYQLAPQQWKQVFRFPKLPRGRIWDPHSFRMENQPDLTADEPIRFSIESVRHDGQQRRRQTFTFRPPEPAR